MDQQLFHKLSEEELFKGMKTCLNNSNNHFKCAEELEKIAQYGIANSHLILSAEEGIKSLLFLSKILDINIKEIDISSYFKKHKPKHTTAKEIYWSFKYNEQINSEATESIKIRINEYIFKQNGQYILDEDRIKKDMNREVLLRGRQLKYRQWKTSWDIEKKEEKWWDKADYYKNRGFYVNNYNNQWETPDDITNEIYSESKVIVTNLLSYLRKVCGQTDYTNIKEHIKFNQMNYIELFNTAPNGMKTDRIILTEMSNGDGSGIDYKIEYIDFIGEERILVGTCDLTLGNIQFVESKSLGIPHSAIRLLIEWIDSNLEDVTK